MLATVLFKLKNGAAQMLRRFVHMNSGLNDEPHPSDFYVVLEERLDQPRQERKALLFANISQEKHVKGTVARTRLTRLRDQFRPERNGQNLEKDAGETAVVNGKLVSVGVIPHLCRVRVGSTGIEVRLVDSCVGKNIRILHAAVEFVKRGDGMAKLEVKRRRTLFTDFLDQSANRVGFTAVSRG